MTRATDTNNFISCLCIQEPRSRGRSTGTRDYLRVHRSEGLRKEGWERYLGPWRLAVDKWSLPVETHLSEITDRELGDTGVLLEMLPERTSFNLGTFRPATLWKGRDKPTSWEVEVFVSRWLRGSSEDSTFDPGCRTTEVPTTAFIGPLFHLNYF